MLFVEEMDQKKTNSKTRKKILSAATKRLLKAVIFTKVVLLRTDKTLALDLFLFFGKCFK